MLVYQILILVLGVFLYRKNKGLIPCFWFILQTICLPIPVFLTGAILDQDILNAYGQQNAVLNLLLLALLIIEFRNLKIYKVNLADLFVTLLYLFFYAIFWGCYHHTNFDFFIAQKDFLTKILVILYLVLIDKTTVKQIVVTFCVVAFVEVLIAFSNHYLGFHLYAFHYISGLGDIGYADVYTSGTFKRFSNLSAYLVVSQAILSSEFFVHKRISTRMFVCVSILLGLLTIFTGSRLGLIVFVLVMMATAFFNYKKNMRFIFLMISLCAILFVKVLSLTDTNISDETSGFSRSLIGLSEKFSKKNKSTTTDEMSSDLISRYWDYNPFGRGKTAYANVEVAYGNINYMVDSRPAFFLVEYGWLYILLVLLYYITNIKILFSKLDTPSKYSILVLFLALLFMSVTDDGIYDSVLFFMLICYEFYCLKLYKHEVKRIKKSY